MLRVIPLLLLLLGLSAQAAPRVVVSISPLHSLVAGVMKGAGQPTLLIDASASPHEFSLKPSQARDLFNADLVFWIGPGLEGALARSMKSVAGETRVVGLLSRLRPTLDHDGKDAHEANRHGHESGHIEADHHEAARHEPGHHDHGDIEPHIWLSPVNAVSMVVVIRDELSRLDPHNAALYKRNAADMARRIAALDARIKRMLEPVRDRPYLAFHDAYGYFARHYGLRSLGALTLNPAQRPGVKRLRDLRKRLLDEGAICVFREPQFRSPLVSVLTEGTQLREGELDPLGANLKPGVDLWYLLIEQLARGYRQCLE